MRLRGDKVLLLGVVAALIIGGGLSFYWRPIAEYFLVERKNLTQGEFHGFVIGATKKDVLNYAKLVGINAISAIPYDQFLVTHSNVRSLNAISNAEAIVVTNNDGVRIELHFEKGGVSEIFLSVPAKENTWFQKGESVTSVIASLRQILRDNPSFIVFPTVKEHDWVYLNNIPLESHWLYRYDAWTFPGIERFSHFQLYFDKTKLARIEYIRPRVELP